MAYDAPINGSNHIYLDNQSVPYPTIHTLSAEKVTNGTFDTDTDWTKGTGWTIDAVTNFRADCDGTQTADSLLTTSTVPTTVADSTYLISFEVTAYTAGNVALQFDGVEIIADQSAVGTYTAEAVASDTTGTIDIVADLDFVGSVDNVTVKEITLPTASYLTYFGSTTNTLTELSSTGDVGENLVTNGDFSDGTTGWSTGDASRGSFSVINGELVIIDNDTNPSGMSVRTDHINWVDGLRVNVKASLISADAGDVPLIAAGVYYPSVSVGLFDEIVIAESTLALQAYGVIGGGTAVWDDIEVRESLPISTTYSVTDSHQFVFNHTSPLSAEDKAAIEADPNLAFRMFLDGEVLPSGFSNTDVGWFSGGNEGLASAEKVYDLSDQAFLTYVSIVGYDAATRTTLANQSNGASNLKLVRNVSGGTTGTASANTTQWEADGRTAVTNWTITAPFTITEETDDDTYTYLSNGNRYKNGSADGTYTVPTGIWTLDNTRFDGTPGVTKRGNTKMVNSLQIP